MALTSASQPIRNNRPAVSIGLPVFNGAEHLGEAIESLLNQTYADFELIISDNCSTDGTRAICERFAGEDARVCYIRQPQNIGAPRNWNVVAHYATGTYFKWASANDYCNERFVEECLLELERDPKAVLAFGRTCLVDDSRDTMTDYEGDVEVLDERPSDRFRRVLRSWALNNAQSGLFRLAVLRKTGLDRPYVGGDLQLMLELSLHGRFKRVPTAVLYRRVANDSMSTNLTREQLDHLIDPLSTSGTRLAAWPKHWDRLTTIVRSPIAGVEKLACIGTTLREAAWDRSRLVRELPILLKNAL